MSKRLDGFYIVLYASLLHIGWTVSLLMSPAEMLATPMADFHLLFGSTANIALVLLVVSVGAVVGKLRYGDGWLVIVAIAGQQALLCLSAWSSAASIVAGHYADGVTRPVHFIFRDQWPNICAVVSHTAYFAVLLNRRLRALCEPTKGANP